MAIRKKGVIYERRENKRNTWTRFHLSRERSWPQWAPCHSNLYFGPLEGVPGLERVRLGRMVEDPEQAVFNILWDNPKALKDFQQSPICGEFLRGLGRDDSEASRESLLVSLQWDSGFCMGDDIRFPDDLRGRVTLTKLYFTYESDTTPDHDVWRGDLAKAFARWMPPGSNLVAGPPAWSWTAIAYVDDDGRQQELPPSLAATMATAAGSSAGQSIAACYDFFRWNAYGATPEHEEASFAQLGTREAWANQIAQAMPPIVAWEQERWDVEVAPPVIDFDTEEGDQGSDEESNQESDEEGDGESDRESDEEGSEGVGGERSGDEHPKSQSPVIDS
ncbi:hypothetical protein B0T19DRAFT_291536 [Cercophora scortea]|uniref:Uncharacterized protein n=1 Tax=Cercophora scortea TaxID=314031 RepID=A0AAE0M4B6_9PEZI|nr:hypothetical protein B0T19DRAFT_291536 [Cercophora scortea]